MISVRSAGVQDMRIGQELDIANIENHVQRETLAGFFKNLQGLVLCWGQRGDDSCVTEAAEGTDVVWVPSGFVG
jgi:hypothetical protein